VPDSDSQRRAHVGLCATCSRARAIRSAKGSEFWLCEYAQVDPRFKKYPVLPVLRCPAFSAVLPAT
jgi:hypothetical protein